MAQLPDLIETFTYNGEILYACRCERDVAILLTRRHSLVLNEDNTVHDLDSNYVGQWKFGALKIWMEA